MKKRYSNITEVEKSVDHVEHVEKANPYHDARGRFTTAGGGGGGAIAIGPGPEGASAAGIEGFGRSRIIRAMTMAENHPARELSGSISSKKVKEALDRGGMMNEVNGKHYLVSPQSDQTMTVYTGTKSKSGGLNTEKYQTGFRDLKDCRDWATGTILNEKNSVKQFKETWEIKKSSDTDHIEEVTKANPYHDKLGRFTSAGGGGMAGPTMAPDGKGGTGGGSNLGTKALNDAKYGTKVVDGNGKVYVKGQDDLPWKSGDNRYTSSYLANSKEVGGVKLLEESGNKGGAGGGKAEPEIFDMVGYLSQGMTINEQGNVVPASHTKTPAKQKQPAKQKTPAKLDRSKLTAEMEDLIRQSAEAAQRGDFKAADKLYEQGQKIFEQLNGK